MKTQIKTLKFGVLFSALFCGATVFAANGGQDSGGGNLIMVSSEADVREALAKTVDQLATAITNGVYPNLAEQTWKNKEDVALLTKMVTQDTPFIFDVVKKVPLDILPDSSCVDSAGKKSAASTIIGQIGAPICLSMPMLRGIPRHSLLAELSGLLFHELTHQFGALEEQASRMQIEFLGIFDRVGFSGPGYQFRAQNLRQGLTIIKLHTLSISVLLAGSGTSVVIPKDKQIEFCLEANSVEEKLSGLNFYLRMATYELNPFLKTSKIPEYLKALEPMETWTERVVDKCKKGVVEPINFKTLDAQVDFANETIKTIFKTIE